MRRTSRAAVVAAGLLLPVPAAWGSPAPQVIVTIKPLHALVAHVMLSVGAPELLVKGAASPHTFALRPADVRSLHRADLFFRMSATVEPFTTKLVTTLPRKVEVLTLKDTAGMTLLGLRTGTTFERHADRGDGHVHADARASDAVDGHAWLDPDNAKAMTERIEQALSARYPAHAATFKANADAMRAKLDALAAELDRDLRPIADKPYVVFHDAMQYFERRYRLNVVGSISISPEVPPSGKRLLDLRRKIVALEAVCVFAEPAFDTRLVDNLIEGTSARTGLLDPEGSRLAPGADLYVALMRGLAADLKRCLAPQS